MLQTKAKSKEKPRFNTKLKRGDVVAIISGKDKGKQGKITEILTKTNRAVVEGVNLITRHTKPSQTNPQGGRVSREGAIHLSNMMLIDTKTNKPTRVGKKLVKGKSVRFAKKSNTEI